MGVRTNGSLLIHSWITAVLVLQLLGSGMSADSKVITSGNITENIGKPVTLLCRASEEETVSQIEWRFGGCDGQKILVFSPRHSGAPELDYNKRVSDVTDHGYTLLKTQKEDAGTYCCSLTAFPSGTLNGLLYLNLTEVIPDSDTHVIIIVYIICGILGVLMFAGLITAILLYKTCRTSGQDPFHVAVHSNRLSHHLPSILHKSQAHGASPSKSSSENLEVEEDDDVDYLNVTAFRLPRIAPTAPSLP
ncbi:hypothetical protein DPEC_G00235140 [Dallia pectoralis]|uniref:Uncharacterized protein n=1 Tax=Dallia pectoralis TaxID=75939 RepID=A0ACC2FXV5_DALPE|nr:hypothetical protein DPEC_G00235140 [Dallia pectoralis]